MQNTDLIGMVAAWRHLRILVIGDAMLDCYYSGRAERISPEGPVPVVQAVDRRHYPGGATNAAANVAGLGAHVWCVGVVGADDNAAILRTELATRRIDDGLVTEEGRATITKLRILADGQYVVRWDEGHPHLMAPETRRVLKERLEQGFAECDAVIVADYCYGVLDDDMIATIGRLKQQYGRLVLVDSKNLPVYRGMAASVITPNHLEAQRALGWTVRDADRLAPADLEALGRRLLEQVGSTWALVTLGARGSLLFERDLPTYHVAPRPVPNPHVSGAGDTFTAALALGLAANAPVRMAVETAAEAAAIVVGKPGTATVTAHELLQRLAHSPYLPLPAIGLDMTIADHRRSGKRIILTNGVFDGLRSGHLAFLRAARHLGDVLIVGVNSDRGAHERDGYPTRVEEAERVAALATLDCVDHVIVFDEPIPDRLIRAIRPDIHVKGGDYRIEDLPEAGAVREVGGEVVILPLLNASALPHLRNKVLRIGD